MKNYTVQSVKRALNLLELISEEKEIGIRELSRRVDFSRSTVQNLVTTLEEEGFLIQNPSNAKYRLSFKLHNLGRHALEQFDLRSIVRPYLEKMMLEVEETVALGILDDCEVIYVDRISFPEKEYFSFLGNRDPIYCTGIGKAILAHLPEIEQSRIFEKLNHQTKLKSFTEKTITNIDDLKRNLSVAKAIGYAISYEERLPGTVSVSAPIRAWEGRVLGAIAVHGFVNRITPERLPLIGQLVCRVSREINACFGYNAPEYPELEKSNSEQISS